jgi:hypothetical protein
MRYPGAEDGEIEGVKHLFVGMESKNLTRSVLAYTLKAMQFVRKNGDSFDIIVENFLQPTFMGNIRGRIRFITGWLHTLFSLLLLRFLYS